LELAIVKEESGIFKSLRKKMMREDGTNIIPRKRRQEENRQSDGTKCMSDSSSSRIFMDIAWCRIAIPRIRR
jgi:hypothetical protein